MGKSALKSHMKGQLHQQEESRQKDASCSITQFFSAKTSAECATVTCTTTVQETADKTPLVAVTVSDDVTKSEVLWALKVVMNHLPFNTCQDVGKVFANMFPDSEIA